MMRHMRKIALVLAVALAPLQALADTPAEDLKTAEFLIGELQACLAGGLGNGGITPSPEDMAAVRSILDAADPLLRQAAILARKSDRSQQEELLLAAWARGGLAMLNEAEEYRLEHGY